MTDAGPRTNLPVLLSRFVGRDQDRAEVTELIRAARLVTMVGAGGVGKTRLSLEVARGVAATFPDGVFFVDLAPITEPGAVPAQLVSVLEIAVAPAATTPAGLLDRLADHLARRRVLLVLDNCEHLLPAVRELVATLLSRCPPLVVLATSRERIGVAGETVWRVPSLSMPADAATFGDLADSDAVALFCDRAAAVSPGFALTPENAADVAQVCRRLDGIPLAIELAVARIGVLSPAEIAARLDDRLRLLTKGSPTAPSRHQTLRACMEWGHDLLPEPERRLLRRLAVFADHVELDAAEAMAPGAELGADSDVLDCLSRLVDSSWVTASVGPAGNRFRLTETVRQFALEQLIAADEEDLARRRHRDHYLVLAGGHRGFPSCAPTAWIASMLANYENLRAALEWSERVGDTDEALRLAGSLFAVWSMDGRYGEGTAWLRRTLDADRGAAGPDRAWALTGLAVLTVFLGGPASEVSALLQQAERISDDVGDPIGGAFALGYRGGMAVGPGEAELGVAMLSQARERFEAAGSAVGTALCDYNLGWAWFDSDRPRAAGGFERAAAIGAREGRDILRAQASAALACAVAADGPDERAIVLAADATSAARRLGLRFVLLMALTREAEVTVLAGRIPEAGPRVREALRLARDAGGQAYVSDLLHQAALVLEDRGDAGGASRLLTAGNLLASGPSPLHDAVEECRRRLLALLGADALAAEENVGAVLSTEEAVDEALAALQPGWTPWASAHRERRTFMFTDIVGSTELAAALGDEAWTGVLHWHDETLRSLFAAHGGEEIKHTGDGFFVAFADADRAVRCAAAIQQRLDRPEASRPDVRVRIGVHETEATRNGRDYHGRGVHEAARIASLAGAREVVISAATAGPLHGWAWSEPRTAHLKGIAEPFDVVNLTAGHPAKRA